MNANNEIQAGENVPTIRRSEYKYEASYVEKALSVIEFRPGIVERLGRLANEIQSGKLPGGDLYHTLQLETLANGGATINAHGAVPTGSESLPVLPTTISFNLSDNEVDKWKKLISSADAPSTLREEVIRSLRGGDADVVLSVTGWGESALEESPWRDKFAEGYSKGGRSNRLIQIGVSAYGYAGTSNYTDANLPKIEDATVQLTGGLSNLVDNINDPKDRNAFWSHLKLVSGHSMGAWVVLNSIKMMSNHLDGAGNKKVLWQIDNPVVHGPSVSEEEIEILTSLLGKEGYDPYAVTLLQHTIYGQVVRLAPELMKIPTIQRLAAMSGVVRGIVQHYIDESGKESTSYREGMAYSVRNYPGFIYNCNMMLGSASPIVGSREQLDLLRDLKSKGMLQMTIGHKDRVLRVGPQYALASAIGFDSSEILDSKTHKISLTQAMDRGLSFSNRSEQA